MRSQTDKRAVHLTGYEIELEALTDFHVRAWDSRDDQSAAAVQLREIANLHWTCERHQCIPVHIGAKKMRKRWVDVADIHTCSDCDMSRLLKCHQNESHPSSQWLQNELLEASTTFDWAYCPGLTTNYACPHACYMSHPLSVRKTFQLPHRFSWLYTSFTDETKLKERLFTPSKYHRSMFARKQSNIDLYWQRYLDEDCRELNSDESFTSKHTGVIPPRRKPQKLVRNLVGNYYDIASPSWRYWFIQIANAEDTMPQVTQQRESRENPEPSRYHELPPPIWRKSAIYFPVLRQIIDKCQVARYSVEPAHVVKEYFLPSMSRDKTANSGQWPKIDSLSCFQGLEKDTLNWFTEPSRGQPTEELAAIHPIIDGTSGLGNGQPFASERRADDSTNCDFPGYFGYEDSLELAAYYFKVRRHVARQFFRERDSYLMCRVYKEGALSPVLVNTVELLLSFRPKAWNEYSK